MDGEVIISTTLDTKQLEKQLKEQENQLKKYEKEAEKLTKAKVDLDLDKQRDEIKRSTEEIDAMAENINKAKDNVKQYKEQIDTLTKDWKIKSVLIDGEEYLRPFAINRLQEKMEETKQLEKDMTAQIKKSQNELDNKYSKYKDIRDKVAEINEQLQENARNQAITRGEIEQTNKELGRAKGIGSIKDMLKDIGKGTEKNIKRVGRWVLALFGIRAMYSAIRNAMNIISENDKQLKDDIKYIQIAMAYMLEPVVKKIVEWIKLLLQYLGYIVYMWSGIDIWKNAEKGLKNANKQAKDLKKTLMGFDEANVISEQKDTGISPSFKLGGYGDKDFDIEIPSWLKWLIKHSREIFAIISGLVTAFTLIKIGIGWIEASGIGLLIAGVVYSVASLIDYITDPSWSNFGSIITGIGVAVAGVGVIVGGLPAIVIGVVVAIVGIVVKYWDKIKEVLQNGLDWLKSKTDWVHDHLGKELGDFYDMILKFLQNGLNYFDFVFKALRGLLDGVIQFAKGVFMKNWEDIFDGLVKIGVNGFKLMIAPVKLIFDNILSVIGTIKSRVKDLINWAIDGVNKLIRGLNKISIDRPDWLGGGRWGIDIPTIPRLATGGIVNKVGSGVMMGNYVAGERGQEGVIPLTDPTAMAQLGEQIGKWVNLAIDNRMIVDGREIASATNNWNKKESFLMNR